MFSQGARKKMSHYFIKQPQQLVYWTVNLCSNPTLWFKSCPWEMGILQWLPHSGCCAASSHGSGHWLMLQVPLSPLQQSKHCLLGLCEGLKLAIGQPSTQQSRHGPELPLELYFRWKLRRYLRDAAQEDKEQSKRERMTDPRRKWLWKMWVVGAK